MDKEIIIASIGICMSSGNIFLYCYVGSTTTDNFLQYADTTYESLWYKFPVDLQKYLRLIIADAQHRRVFKGLGIIDLNLIVFAGVMRTTFDLM